MRPGFSRARQVICQISLGQPGATNGEASLAQCMLGTEDGSDRRKAHNHGQSIVNPAAEHYKSAVEALLRDAGSIAEGAELTPITEADLTVESHDEIVALQERLCQRLYVAHGPNGLMFYLLDRDQPGCTVAAVARKLKYGPHPHEGRNPAEWGGRQLDGPALPKTPGVKETLALLAKIWRENGARAAP